MSPPQSSQLREVRTVPISQMRRQALRSRAPGPVPPGKSKDRAGIGMWALEPVCLGADPGSASSRLCALAHLSVFSPVRWE